MWRHKPKPSESEKPLRQQLVEACENVRRQIEIQQQTVPDPDGFRGGFAITGEEIAIRELEAELAQLEEALAALDSDNS